MRELKQSVDLLNIWRYLWDFDTNFKVDRTFEFSLYILRDVQWNLPRKDI